jgi:membrane glycosyltransferase
VDSVVDPVINAVACASGTARLRPSDVISNERRRLVELALVSGPEALNPREKMTLLNDPMALSQLHFQVWASPQAAQAWGTARMI